MHVLVVSIDHVKKILRGFLLMSKDKGPDAFTCTGVMIIATSYICRAALLPSLKDISPNPADPGLLFF
jgi:hypothetical protein